MPPSEMYKKDCCGVKELFSSLEQIISQTEPSACPPLLGELERLKALLWARMVHTEAISPASTLSSGNGRYLTLQEVVTRFGVTDRWLYRHKKKLPHSQPSRKVLLFPEKATERWFASRKAS
jgi:predicted DNA-binding transcriptional regulator AlpA